MSREKWLFREESGKCVESGGSAERFGGLRCLRDENAIRYAAMHLTVDLLLQRVFGGMA